MTFSPPMEASLPGARVSLAVIGSPASSVSVTASGVSFLKAAFCCRRGRGVDARVVRRAELRGQIGVMHAGVFAGAGGDLGGQQVQNDAVLVGGPDRAVAAEEAGPRAFFAAEAEEPSNSPVGEPLESHRHLRQLPPQALHHAVDHAAADQRLADRRLTPATAGGGSAGTGSRRPGNDWGSSTRPMA